METTKREGEPTEEVPAKHPRSHDAAGDLCFVAKSDLDVLSVEELKYILMVNRLDQTGNKEDFIARILELELLCKRDASSSERPRASIKVSDIYVRPVISVADTQDCSSTAHSLLTLKQLEKLEAVILFGC